ncbi:MAG: type II secretion system F family protein [Firmicutes bacterium]|nr:type II secretion system F family protein [Bacillota bacterium]
MLPFDRAGPRLSEESLTALARRNLLLIAAIGALIIGADLLLSVTAQSISIESENGTWYLIRPAAEEPAGHIGLDASVQDGSGTIVQHYDVRLDPLRTEDTGEPSEEESRQTPSSQELIRSELRALSSGFNEDTGLARIPLPAALDSGQTIQWSRSRSTHTLLLAALTALLMVLIYRSRFRPIRRREEEQRRSVRQHLPSFINELVLLLNAGLVLSRAFETVVEESMLRQPAAGEETDYFNMNICAIYRSAKTTNAVLHEELKRFAKESGTAELMRISSIIADNINKGAELNRKLERESEQLWLSRRLHAEEQGRLAETKMTLPLAIFLCVLIVITVSPALLQL